MTAAGNVRNSANDDAGPIWAMSDGNMLIKRQKIS